MWAVCKREFRSLLQSVRGLIFLGTYLLAAGVFTTVINFNQGSGTFETALSYMLLSFLLLLPILCIGMLGDGSEADPDRILRFLPLRMHDILLGKYLARLCVLGVPTLVLALYPLLLDLYGDVNVITIYLTLLALFCLGALLLALFTLIAVLLRRTAVALPVMYGIAILWYAVGIVADFIPDTPLVSLIAILAISGVLENLIGVWSRRRLITTLVAVAVDGSILALYFFNTEVFVGALPRLLKLLSPFRSLDDFVFGLPDWRLLIGYLLWIGLLLALAYLFYAKREGERVPNALVLPLRRFGKVAVSLGLVFAVAVAAVGISLLPSRFMRTDVTAEKSYTLSEQTQKYLSELTSDVTLCVLNPNGEDVRLERFLARLTDYSSHLTVTYQNLDENPELAEQYGLSGTEVSPYTVIVASEARIRVISYSDLFTFSNATLGFSQISASQLAEYESALQSQAEYYAYLQYDTVRYFEGDTLFPKLIEYVVADAIPSVYLLEDFGTPMADSIIAYCLYYYGLEFSSLNWDRYGAIPDDAASLILCAPQRDLTDREAAELREYLQNGGQLTLLTDTAALSFPNLTALLDEYELSADPTFLVETVEVEVESDGESTESKEPLPQGPAFEEESNASETDTVIERVESTSLTVTPNLNHDVMAVLGDRASLSVVVNGANAISYPKDPEGSLLIYPLLTTSTEAHPSGDEESQAEYAVAVAAEKANGARIVWFTGADSYLNTETVNQTLSNATCVALSALWTSWQYTSALKQVPNTPYTSMTLNVTSTDATLMGALLILLVPAAAVSVCVLVRYRRKKS